MFRLVACGLHTRAVPFSIFSALRPFASSDSKLPDFFGFLKLEPSFALDDQKLYKAYLALQREYHPDRFAVASAADRSKAAEMSTLANTAYETLKDPHSRAKYMLESRGVKEMTSEMGNEFLEEMMEVMGALSMIRDAKKDADAKVLEQIKSGNVAQYQETVEQLGKAFDCNDLKLAEKLTGKLKFLKNIRELVKEKEMGSQWVSTQKH